MENIITESTEKQYSVESYRLRYKASTPAPKKPLTSPTRVAEMAKSIFNELDGGASVEHFGVCFLNTQNELIGFKAFNTGTIDQVAVYPRMIIHTALMIGAAAMILIHNHPTGHTEPSEEDKRLTRAIRDAGKVLDVRTCDHLIIDDQGKYFSFTERGLI